jgi:hypothetical protein
MKKFWNRNKNLIILLIVWRFVLFIIEKVSPFIIPLHDGYNGPIPWANHDGIHYLTIAREGYFQYSEAFFPLYPLFLNMISKLGVIQPWVSAAFASFVLFSSAILLLFNTLYDENKNTAWWTALFFIVFPTSFFFCAVYSESLFFFLSVLVFLFTKKRLWFWASVFGALASATRLFGVLLFFYVSLEYLFTKEKKRNIWDICFIFMIPIGLLSYMAYLYMRSGDPLLFFHIQPAFGANRSGSTLILLPQVIWRYIKIIVTAFLQPTPASYFISVMELLAAFFGYILLCIGWKQKERWSLLLYGLATLSLPSLTGTFSSMPRYLLSIFPLFFILGKLDNTVVRYWLLVIFILLQIILSAMFLRGWFVA